MFTHHGETRSDQAVEFAERARSSDRFFRRRCQESAKAIALAAISPMPEVSKARRVDGLCATSSRIACLESHGREVKAGNGRATFITRLLADRDIPKQKLSRLLEIL